MHLSEKKYLIHAINSKRAKGCRSGTREKILKFRLRILQYYFRQNTNQQNDSRESTHQAPKIRVTIAVYNIARFLKNEAGSAKIHSASKIP